MKSRDMSTAAGNTWCRTLKIEPPRLEKVAGHPDANTFALLLVTLLERGVPMTLLEVAERFEEAGIANRSRALLSLQRSRPARPPVYRDGDRYHLDPHDEMLDLWAFKLGLRPPKGSCVTPAEPEPVPLPGPDEPLTLARRYGTMRTDPVVVKSRIAEWESRRNAHGAELVRLSRALLTAYPKSRPQVVALLDVGKHTVTTFVGKEMDALRAHLATYEHIGALEVRTLLRALGFDPGERHLAELGPPQKAKTLNRRGRKLKITTALLVQGSCGIGRPFGDEGKLAEYLARGDLPKLRRRLEADVKSLYALYEYGRLHGAVRLRWGFLDEWIPAPWVHGDEPKLHDLKKSALELNIPLEVVVGNAPGWAEPWSRARLAYVKPCRDGWSSRLVGQDGYVIDEADVQCARLSEMHHSTRGPGGMDGHPA